MSVVYEAKGFIYEIKCYYLLHDILWDESQYYNIRIIGFNYDKPWHNYDKKVICMRWKVKMMTD